MTIEQEVVSPATAGGAPAPDYPVKQIRATAEFYAQLVGCTVVEGEPRGYTEPAPCDVDADGNWPTTRALRAVGKCGRRQPVSPNQFATYCDQPAGHDGWHHGGSGTEWLDEDQRDAEIKQLRYELRQSREDARRFAAEIARLRYELRQREQRGFDAYAELLNPIRAVFGKPPVTASHYRELHDSITALIGRLNAKESIKDKALTERDEARNERDRLRAERDGLNNKLTNAEAERDVAQANERDLRRRLKRIAQETSFESALDKEPRHWVACEDEPDHGTTVRSARGGIYTRLKSGYWHRVDDCIHGDPELCDDAGYSWGWLTGHAEHLPLVEVVSTDGQ